MSYNTNLQTNNTNLQAIYNTVNSLPDKGSLPTIKEYIFTLKDGTTVSKFIEDVSIITFTIVNSSTTVEASAVEGMTWREWINSNYYDEATLISICDCGEHVTCSGNDLMKDSVYGTSVLIDDLIVSGGRYYKGSTAEW